MALRIFGPQQRPASTPVAPAPASSRAGASLRSLGLKTIQTHTKKQNNIDYNGRRLCEYSGSDRDHVPTTLGCWHRGPHRSCETTRSRRGGRAARPTLTRLRQERNRHSNTMIDAHTSAARDRYCSASGAARAHTRRRLDGRANSNRKLIIMTAGRREIDQCITAVGRCSAERDVRKWDRTKIYRIFNRMKFRI
ncbi:hypothetical protein EVAR_75976_1 [Eumeta japonica]|uniref:Uncharacterized protein n=1 Tax=Eumeta variegata TaxID=151549 RepID=A0A4C1U9Z4_EUMVA|nr:hypothetical protein EVAR_75976_1 [Eumeta japonica]